MIYDHASINHETDHLWHDCYRLATSAHLFACMAIEGFLNCYGVKRLGEDFYKRNVERLGITEKLSLLALSCQGRVLEKDSELLKKTRRLFDVRNSLVHPKAREIDFDRIEEYSVNHPELIPIEANMALIEDLIDGLCELDPNVIRDFEFSKPNKTL